MDLLTIKGVVDLLLTLSFQVPVHADIVPQCQVTTLLACPQGIDILFIKTLSCMHIHWEACKDINILKVITVHSHYYKVGDWR